MKQTILYFMEDHNQETEEHTMVKLKKGVPSGQKVVLHPIQVKEKKMQISNRRIATLLRKHLI